MRPFRLWLRALFLRRHVEHEMRREMQLHLQLETEANLRRGMSESEARRAALIAFGGIGKAEEAVRDERLTRTLEIVVGDVRYAIRGFARRPLFASVIITLLAVGIGANTALFGVVYQQLISPLPFKDGSRMVHLQSTGAQGTIQLPIAPGLQEAWARSPTVEQMVVVGVGVFAVGDTTQDRPRQVYGAVLPPGASAFVGIHPVLGRDIQPTDTLSSAPPVVLLSDQIWRRDFAADRGVVGRSILIEGVGHVVIGVVPPAYAMPFIDERDIFLARRALSVNATRSDSLLNSPTSDGIPLAKLRPGMSVDDANREMSGLFERWKADPPAAQFVAQLGGVVIDPPRVVRAIDDVRPATREAILVLFAAVSLVLLITCANVANLLLVRAWSRQREVAVRAAIGASRGRLMAQVLTEGAILSLAGAFAGIGVATLVLRGIQASQLGRTIGTASLQPSVLVWCLALSLFTTITFGLAPARFAAEDRMTDALKAGARSQSGGSSARRVRTALVGLEIALSFVLLAGAGLLVRTLMAMGGADIGIDTRDLVSVEVRFPQKRFSLDARRAAVGAIRSHLEALELRDLTISSMTPPRFGIGLGGLQFENRPTRASDSLSAIGFNDVDPAYFARVGLRVTRGRIFQADTRLSTDKNATEVMVNERLARRFFPNGNAVGQHLKYGKLPWSTIVGVVADVDIPGLNDRARSLQLYMPISPVTGRANFVFRSTRPVFKLDSLIRAIVRDAAPGATVGNPIIADELLSGARQTQHSLLQVIGAFALVALCLAAIGLHAVIAFSVGQRTREIGMRVALGAAQADVVRLILRQGLSLSLWGVAVGGGGALLTSRALSSFLYGVHPRDPVTIVAVGALVAVVAVVASLPPAWRAARIDPIEALRAD